MTTYFIKPTNPPRIITLIALTGMGALVMNMFLPSLPSMAIYFHTEYHIIQLAIAINLTIGALLQLIVGPLSDHYGRRPLIILALVIFLLATIGCLLATNIWMFLVFRAFQAVIAVGAVLARAIVRDVYPQDQAASVLGYVIMGMSVIPMISPAIGGFLDESYGWHTTFWMLFICGILTLTLAWRDLGETALGKGRKFRDQVRDYPTILASCRFWGYTLAAAFSSGAFFAYLGGAPLISSKVFGLSPSELGLYFAAPSVGYFLGNFLSGRYSVHFGVKRMVFWGCVIAVVGLAADLILAIAYIITPEIFFGFMIFLGLGNGLINPNAMAGALSVNPQLAGTAAGLSSALIIGIGAALSAIAGSVITPEYGTEILLGIMTATALAGLASIILVIWRDRQLVH